MRALCSLGSYLQATQNDLVRLESPMGLRRPFCRHWLPFPWPLGGWRPMFPNYVPAPSRRSSSFRRRQVLFCFPGLGGGEMRCLLVPRIPPCTLTRRVATCGVANVGEGCGRSCLDFFFSGSCPAFLFSFLFSYRCSFSLLFNSDMTGASES